MQVTVPLTLLTAFCDGVFARRGPEKFGAHFRCGAARIYFEATRDHEGEFFEMCQGATLVGRRGKVCAAICACAIVLAAGATGANRGPQSASWTRYTNTRWGFCVDYPSRWNARVLTDGSGVTLYPYSGEDSSNGPYISITGLPDQPDVDNANIVLDDSPPLNLTGNFSRALDGLREYDHASDIRVLGKRTLQFQGFDALSTSIRYRMAPDGTEVANETLWINREYIIFTATLLASPQHVRDLEPAYQEIMQRRFKLDCGATK